MMRILQGTVDCLTAVTAFVLLPAAWLLRDGLGPDSVASSGFAAAGRWLMTFYSGPILAALVAAALTLRVLRRQSRDASRD